MKSNYILLLILLPLYAAAQQSITNGVYAWPSGSTMNKKNTTATLLSGSAYDLASIEVIAQTITPGKTKRVDVGSTEEHLLLVKSGDLTITLNDSTYMLGKGSIAMMMPGENYFTQNKSTTPCQIHVMKYQSNSTVDIERGRSSGGSFVKDWNKLTFRPHERGGVRSYFDRPTANTKRFEMHVTTLKANFKSHDPHQHRAEEIIIVLEGKVEMLIGERTYLANAGDVLFASTNVFHGLKNISNEPSSYFAFQWE